MTHPDSEIVLFLGGARSGKSRLAQTRAESASGECVYVATAETLDAEMADRIARHRADRDARWRTVDAPLDLAEVIRRESASNRVLLVDCLTLWLTNLILANHDVPAATSVLLAVLAEARGTVLIVSNEVGLGIVPDNALARRFRDEAGRLNQAVAHLAHEVLFVAAGLALKMK